MSVGVLEDYKLRDLRASHTLRLLHRVPQSSFHMIALLRHIRSEILRLRHIRSENCLTVKQSYGMSSVAPCMDADKLQQTMSLADEGATGGG
jgi:hypothetical protein